MCRHFQLFLSTPLSPTRALSRTSTGREAPLHSSCLLLSGYLESHLEEEGQQPNKDGFPELNQGIDPRAPEPWWLPPAASSPSAIFSPDTELAPEPSCLPLPWASDPDFLFPDLGQGLTPCPAHINRSINIFTITSGRQLPLPIYHLRFMLSPNLCVFDPDY